MPHREQIALLRDCFLAGHRRRYVVLTLELLPLVEFSPWNLAVLILRAYALYGKSRWVLALTCGITLVAASLAIVCLRSSVQASDMFP